MESKEPNFTKLLALQKLAPVFKKSAILCFGSSQFFHFCCKTAKRDSRKNMIYLFKTKKQTNKQTKTKTRFCGEVGKTLFESANSEHWPRKSERPTRIEELDKTKLPCVFHRRKKIINYRTYILVSTHTIHALVFFTQLLHKKVRTPRWNPVFFDIASFHVRAIGRFNFSPRRRVNQYSGSCFV